MEHHKIALQIGKRCFLAVGIWYVFVCAYTWYDTEVIIDIFDHEYTLWWIRAYWARLSLSFFGMLWCLEKLEDA